jgi:tRNA (adenine-N(1)-)-methyltransferase non-catalytic subunit
MDETQTISVLQNGKHALPYDPLLHDQSTCVREGDYVVLVFADARQMFAQCTKHWNGKGRVAPLKINKRNFATGDLIGLPYGTVLEVSDRTLVALPPTEDLVPNFDEKTMSDFEKDVDVDETDVEIDQIRDNRNLVDNNDAQALDHFELLRMRESGVDGSKIVKEIIQNSSTFDQKTEFSKAKYIARKQKKYQLRCRIIRCTPASICEALYVKDPKKIMNLREDTLAQILSYANVSAGCQSLIFETCFGLVTGAVACRMGGYGRVLSLYSGQQPSYTEMIQRFNLTFAENLSIKWLHSGDVFGQENISDEDDADQKDREQVTWPCPLQDHTREYLKTMKNDEERESFLLKRSARFTRKMTRHTPVEAKGWLKSKLSDSLVIATRYNATETLLGMLPYLSPSCPFVVFCEFLEPLTACFRELQRQDLAINLRLSDTWAREYQVLPGRTHPNMNMSQSGGFILTGVKLDEETGHNDLGEDLLKQIRSEIGGRRGRKSPNQQSILAPKKRNDGQEHQSNVASKRQRTKA